MSSYLGADTLAAPIAKGNGDSRRHHRTLRVVPFEVQGVCRQRGTWGHSRWRTLEVSPELQVVGHLHIAIQPFDLSPMLGYSHEEEKGDARFTLNSAELNRTKVSSLCIGTAQGE